MASGLCLFCFGAGKSTGCARRGKEGRREGREGRADELGACDVGGGRNRESGRGTAVTTAGLELAEPLLAGAPAAGMKAQAVVGFVDREGGSFFPEWSGLFVLEGSQGERIFYHYPRLQPVVGSTEKPLVPSKPTPLEVEERLKPLVVSPKYQGTLEQIPLTALCRALPIADPLDGEPVLCYRSFLPAANTLV